MIDLKVEIVKVGYLETNCYLLEKSGKVLVIDPGDEFYKIKKAIGEKDVVGVVITHYHDDHIGALEELLDEFDVDTYDVENLAEGKCSIGEFEFECIRTPGHKEDAISLYFEKEKMLFSGDFIFHGTIGRWDFPYREMGFSRRFYSRDEKKFIENYEISIRFDSFSWPW